MSQFDSGKIQLPGLKTGLNSFRVLYVSSASGLTQQDFYSDAMNLSTAETYRPAVPHKLPTF